MERHIEKVAPAFPPKAKALRVAAYARVSTGKDAMRHSLSAQVSYYSNLIQHHKGWSYCGVYADEALTGTKEDRAGFQKLIAECKAGNIDRIITKSISRFARNTVTLLTTVRALKELGVGVYFEEQDIDTSTSDGELMLTILASFAQEESLSVSENTKWRVRQKFENGLPWNCTILGYRWDGQQLVIVPQEAEIVREVYTAYLSGAGLQAIATQLNERGTPTRYGGGQWSPATVHRLLCNCVYTGNLLLQKTFSENHLTKRVIRNDGQKPKYYCKGSHEAIIDMATFTAVQEERARRAARFQPKTAPARTYPFTGLLVCDHCGKHFKRRVVRDRHIWKCSTYEKLGKDACPAKQVPEEVLNALVAPVLERLQCVRVCDGNRVVLCFKDGTSEERFWTAPSRADSWTPEMKESARQSELARRKNNGE